MESNRLRAGLTSTVLEGDKQPSKLVSDCHPVHGGTTMVGPLDLRPWGFFGTSDHQRTWIRLGSDSADQTRFFWFDLISVYLGTQGANQGLLFHPGFSPGRNNAANGISVFCDSRHSARLDCARRQIASLPATLSCVNGFFSHSFNCIFFSFLFPFFFPFFGNRLDFWSVAW